MATNASTHIPPHGAASAGENAWRTAVTLLLIFHLFALGIAVLSEARPISPLRNKLSDVPIIRQYLQLLRMDLAYNFHLTDGTLDDVDHSILVAPQEQAARGHDSDGRLDGIELPPRGMQPPIRRKRFQQLALVTALGPGEDPAVQALLAKAVASGLLRHADAPPGTYRFLVRRQLPVARENAASPVRSLSDDASRYETAYEGAVILGPSQVDFLEVAPEAERAGVRDSTVPDANRPE